MLDTGGRAWIIGPFIGAIALTAGNALEQLGLEGGDIVTGPAVFVPSGHCVFASRLPVVQRPVRRLLVAPFVLLSGAVFQGLVVEFTGSAAGFVDLPALLADPQAIAIVVTVAAIILAVSWIFYSMLVFAPRKLADPGRIDPGLGHALPGLPGQPVDRPDPGWRHAGDRHVSALLPWCRNHLTDAPTRLGQGPSAPNGHEPSTPDAREPSCCPACPS